MPGGYNHDQEVIAIRISRTILHDILDKKVGKSHIYCHGHWRVARCCAVEVLHRAYQTCETPQNTKVIDSDQGRLCLTLILPTLLRMVSEI
jgi:hypothetical protein